MYLEQMYTGCLSEAAYYVESEGEAIIIDPIKEPQPYLQMAKERGAKIKYIFETHFHADFVSGHVELSKLSGAQIVFGPTAKTNYEIIEAKDGQEFTFGGCTIRVLHTPGHTPESSTFLLIDESGKQHSIFTGDTLFIGDVGRPDLAQKEGSITAEDMAGTLYDSLRKKIIPLPDSLLVYPAHGAGSACGKNLSDEKFSTLGDQKANNYALRDISKEEFVKELTEGILPPPQYFAKAAALNKQGSKDLDEVYNQSLTALNADQVDSLQKSGALVLDTRHQNDFKAAHVPGAWFIGLHGQYAVWAGTVIEDLHRPIVIIAEEGKEKEAITRLARVGYDNVKGFLEGGIQAWTSAGYNTAEIESVEAQALADLHSARVVDVRKPGEYDAAHVANAESFPLDFILNSEFKEEAGKCYLHCKSGFRSVIAISILKSQGVANLVDVKGGFDALAKTNIPIEKPVMMS